MSGQSASERPESRSAAVGGAANGGRIVGVPVQHGVISFSSGTKSAFAVPRGSGRTLADVGTIECWVNPPLDPGAGTRTLLSVGPDLQVSVADDNGSLVVSVDINTTHENDTTIDYPFGTDFHHLAVLPLTGDVYAFGQWLGNFTPPKGLLTGTGTSLDHLQLGGHGAQAFEGNVAGLRLWEIELTADQLAAVARRGDPEPVPTPEAMPELELATSNWPLIAYSLGSELVYEVGPGPWVSRRTVGAVPDQAHVEGLDPSEHGYYETSRYLSFVFDPETNRRLALDSDGAVWHLTPDDTQTGVLNLVDEAGNVAAQFTRDPLSTRLRFSDVAQNTTRTWIPVKPSADTVAQTWSDAFANQAPSLRYSLLGWDVRFMDLPPRIEDTGVQQEVFARPHGQSKNFHMAAIEKGGYVALPLGLHYAPRSTSEMDTTTVFSTNSHEDTASTAWGHEISVKGEVVLGPFEGNIQVTHNHQHQTKSSTMRSSESSQARTTATAANYALVLDRANMSLSDLFVATVNEIADDLGRNRDDLLERIRDALVGVFGTHYAHAVTYGGRASRALTMTKSGFRSVIEHGYSVNNEVNAGFGLEEGDRKTHTAGGGSEQVAVKWNRSHESGDENAHSSGLEREKIRGFGSLSAEGGIHEGSDNPMPVFVDHRSIAELLAPPYFSDPKITIELRRELEFVLEQDLIGPDIQWGSYFIEFRGLFPPNSPEWQQFANRPRISIDQSRYETIPWRGVNRDWPETWNGGYRDLQEMHDEVGWLRVIAPAGAATFHWTYNNGEIGYAAEAPLDLPAIFDADIEIFRDRYVSVNAVPSRHVLSGGWAIPPPPAEGM